jgi:cardiolipin synthase A/B
MSEHFAAGNWLTLHSAAVMLGLVIYAAASRGDRQRRHPSAAIAWVISLALLPYVALPVYFLFGTRKAPRKPHVPQSLAVPADRSPAGRLQALAMNLGLGPPTSCDDLNLHEDGAAALARLEEIALGARHTLDVGTFLLGRDSLGRGITQLLARRAAQGVKVRLLVDGVGLYVGGWPSLKALTRAGAEVALFVPPWASSIPGRINLRNHRKVVIADGKRLWMGGRNLACEYFAGEAEHTGESATPWIDLTFDAGGGIAGDAQAQFQADWDFARHQLPTVNAGAPQNRAGAGAKTAQLIPSGPDQSEDTLQALLVDACFSAQHRILAVTPYFVPDPTLLMALTLAAKRGVKIDLVLPRRSNHRLADIARPPAIRDMVASGASVWLVPRMVHAKAIVVDDVLALAGSANLDERSLFLNYELMVAFYAAADTRRFADWIEKVRATGSPVKATRVGMLHALAEGLLRLLVFQL